MNLYLQHVNILTPDIEGTIAFYQDKLGMRLMARFYQEDVMDIAFLRDGPGSSPFSIELVGGPPFPNWMQDLYSECGPMRDHFSFVVDDVDDWYLRLKERGIEFLQAPEEFLTVKEMYFLDPCGTVVEMMQYLDPKLSLSDSRSHKTRTNIEFRLHHMSITCDNLDDMEQFYVEELGLKTVLDYRDEWILFLADHQVIQDPTRHIPTIEIIAPPSSHWDRTDAFRSKYGAGVDHISFVVDDVDSAYNDLVGKGVEFTVEPEEFGDTKIAFFKDPNGLDIEIELPNLNDMFDM